MEGRMSKFREGQPYANVLNRMAAIAYRDAFLFKRPIDVRKIDAMLDQASRAEDCIPCMNPAPEKFTPKI